MNLSRRFNILCRILLTPYKEHTMEQRETAQAVESAKGSSLGTRIVNVFSSPGELFTEVAGLPVQKSSWVVPYIVSLFLVLIFTYALFSNVSLRQQIYDMQLQGMQKAVEEGKMTQAQLDRTREGMESSGLGMFMLIGGVSQSVIVSVIFFGLALVLWLIAKFGLKASAGYAKLLEVTGLATFIGIVGTVVTLLLMYVFDSLHATPGLWLAVLSSYDHENKLHRLLSSINVFTLWETFVTGIGLSKISGKSPGVGMGAAFGLWVLWTILSVALGWGRM